MEEHKLKVLDPEEGVSRRSFLELLGAGLVAGGIAACEPPRGEILPYSRQPREVTPGKPQVYATSIVERGYASGLLATSWSGRPTKLDGNPEHPATLGGGSSIHHQAAVFGLYDPTRARTIRRGKQSGSWTSFFTELQESLAPDSRPHFLLEPTSSPLSIEQIRRIRKRLPSATFHFYDPVDHSAELAAARRAFGKLAIQRLHLDRAQVIAAFDADFLMDRPFHIRYAYEYATHRRVRSTSDGMSRLYVAEGEVTVTGAIADHRIRTRPSRIPDLLLDLLGAIARGRARLAPERVAGHGDLLAGVKDRASSPWIDVLADDLLAHQGAGLVAIGPRQPEEAHVLVHALNAILGNLGQTVTFTDPVLFEAGTESHGLAPLAESLQRGEVDALMILGVDPVYTAPADLELESLLPKAKLRIYSGLHENTTSRACEWFIPAVHFLEQWGDARAYDGTLSLIQPLIRPLYGGHSASEILAAAAGDPAPDDRSMLRYRYVKVAEDTWERALRHGFFSGALPPLGVRLNPDAARAAVGALVQRSPVLGLELSLRPDPKLGAGEHGSNDWLIELPDPITRLAWGNAAAMSLATASKLGLRETQVIELAAAGRSIRIPVLPVMGMADDLVSVNLGWGNGAHPREEEHGLFSAKVAPVGVNAFPLRTNQAPWIVGGATAQKAARKAFPYAAAERVEESLAITQTNLDMQDRPILLTNTLEGFRAVPDFVSPTTTPSPISTANPGPTPGSSGACRSTSRPASDATPAWWPARRRTTRPRSAGSTHSRAGRCTGSASIAIGSARATTTCACFRSR
ncbi:Molybdopterin oxidoreductase, iron-sulfur binding subunit [Vulgatibacter incomptus]|uniref:Molybdopterin oxidoreductase, iron-sulfur binding subunit n=1 Tax=Vulgatibacter incomptus TaxID=1391653 RepID=A0A0K1P9P7_9BACT|nr:Molybdopterin oxidoreductase, iron-sulfur binding subunit [Vulgatibacter incomptus]